MQQADILNLDSDSFDSSPHNSSHTNSVAVNSGANNPLASGSGSSGGPWRSNPMSGIYETEMTRLKKGALPESFYGHNLFHDNSQA